MRHDIHEYGARNLLPTCIELGHSSDSGGSAEHVRCGTICSQHRTGDNDGPLVTGIEGIREDRHSQQQRRRTTYPVSIQSKRIFLHW